MAPLRFSWLYLILTLTCLDLTWPWPDLVPTWPDLTCNHMMVCFIIAPSLSVLVLWQVYSALIWSSDNDFFLRLCFSITVAFWLPPTRFWKTAGGIVLGSVAVSADVLPYISVAIKASFSKLAMCNMCKNSIAKMFLDFFLKILNCSFDRGFLFLVKNLWHVESQKPFGGFLQNLQCRHI